MVVIEGKTHVQLVEKGNIKLLINVVLFLNTRLKDLQSEVTVLPIIFTYFPCFR